MEENILEELRAITEEERAILEGQAAICLLYTSDAADERYTV